MRSSFVEKIKAAKDGLYLVLGTDQNKKSWYYVEAEKLKSSLLEGKVAEQKYLDLEQFGRVICSGWGIEPPAIVKRKIEEQGANYNAGDDVELAGYYAAATKVFFINGTAEGRACYYYLLVDGHVADEFARVCETGESPDLADYGKIIESGWGEPSNVVKAYMKEKYNVETPEGEHIHV